MSTEHEDIPPKRRRIRGNGLLLRAVRAGWRIPEDAKRLATERMRTILEDESADDRSWATAARILTGMSTAEQGAIQTVLAVRAATELEGRLQVIEQHLKDHPDVDSE